MECNELIEQLSDYLDPEAQKQLCREIEDHLSRCRDCSLYVDSVKKTIVIVQAGNPANPPVWMNDRLQSALSRAYQTSPPPDSD
ncbi:MAG: zf-HC2 domain-containing protein [Candidatus Eisenbacteria bacterium]